MQTFQKLTQPTKRFLWLTAAVVCTVGILIARYSIAGAATADRSFIRADDTKMNDLTLNAGVDAICFSISSPRDHTTYLALVATDADGKIIESLSNGVFNPAPKGRQGKCELALVRHYMKGLVDEGHPRVAWTSALVVSTRDRDQVQVKGPVKAWEPPEIDARSSLRSMQAKPRENPAAGKVHTVWETNFREDRQLPDGRVDTEGPIVFHYKLIVKFVKTKPDEVEIGNFDFRRIEEIE